MSRAWPATLILVSNSCGPADFTSKHHAPKLTHRHLRHQNWAVLLRLTACRNSLPVLFWVHALTLALNCQTWLVDYGVLTFNLLFLYLDGQLIFMPSDIMQTPGCTNNGEVNDNDTNANSSQQQSAQQMDKNYPVWGRKNGPVWNIPIESNFWLKSRMYSVKFFTLSLSENTWEFRNNALWDRSTYLPNPLIE